MPITEVEDKTTTKKGESSDGQEIIKDYKGNGKQKIDECDECDVAEDENKQ